MRAKQPPTTVIYRRLGLTFVRLMLLCPSILFGRRVRQRFRFLYGTDEAVLEALSSTVAPENLPPPMGRKPLDFQGWLMERIKAEA